MNKRIIRFLTRPVTIAVIFILAVLLLGFGTVGGARAALTYYSETYASQVEMHDIGITLMENGVDISNRDYFYEKADGTWDEHTGVLLANMLTASNGVLAPGRRYEEKISIKNTGTIDEYVRVTVYRYWVDANGNKTHDIDPALIDLHTINLVGTEGANCWIEDTTARTAERNVYYYNKLLPKGQITPDLSDTLAISYNIAANVKTVQEGNTIITSYDYNGYKFMLEVTADAVQDHNAEDAILSAWGIKAHVANKVLDLPYLSQGKEGEQNE